jgi:uncharacterized protein (DUF1800 family)
MDEKQAYIALNKFGFGVGPNDMQAVQDQGGVMPWLDIQIKYGASYATRLSGHTKASGELLEEYRTAQRSKDQKLIRETRQSQRKALQSEILARMGQAAMSFAPFAERLLHFWSNHFTVSGQGKALITGMLGAYEREAIRPHIFGKFEDMLLAVEQHPAMLIYLDNHQSVGPNSVLGKRRNRGLNENLAREILELHTLGVNGGYSQHDVIQLAKIITGWSIKNPKQQGGPGFMFQHNMHELGQKQLLGKIYGSSQPHKDRRQAMVNAQREGHDALKDLARHPATAEFIAIKLARHFISDQPPRSAIDALRKDFLRTGGELKSLYTTLINLPELWKSPFLKYKPPHEYLISVLRMSGVNINENEQFAGFIRQALTMMDHKPFMALSPAGWGDTEADWLSPDSLMNRIDWVHSFTNRYNDWDDMPIDFAKKRIGMVATPKELTAIAQAPSKKDGYALTLLSSYMMRR